MTRSPDGWGCRPHQWRGRWRAYLTIGYRNGKPARKWVYGRTEAECIAKLDQARQEHAAGLTPADARTRLDAYLTDWLKRARRNVQANTLSAYESKMKRVTSRCGPIKLTDVSPLVVQRWVDQIEDEISAQAAVQARELLAQALSDAVRLGLIARNPVEGTRGPRVERDAKHVWSAGEVGRFLETTGGGCAYHALFYTALTTGLRPGELLALEWGDLTRDAVHVSRTVMNPKKRTVGPPKTKASRRIVPLPQDARQVLDAHRVALSNDGIDTATVFPTRSGRISHHSNIARVLRVWAKRSGVRADVTPHTLRHTFASMAIAHGMDVAELARRLGHAHPGVTLRTYVHFFERRERRPAPGLSDLLGGIDGGISSVDAN